MPRGKAKAVSEYEDLKKDWYQEDLRDDGPEPEPIPKTKAKTEHDLEPEPEAEKPKAKSKAAARTVILRCHSDPNQVRDTETTMAELEAGVEVPNYTVRVQVLPS